MSKITLSELKAYNPLYFKRGTDKMFGIKGRKIITSPKGVFMVEKGNFGYSVRKLTRKGRKPEIGSPITKINTHAQAVKHIGKNFKAI